MPLIKSSSDAAVGKNIAKEMEAGKAHKQAVAIALAVQDRAKQQAAADKGQSKMKPTTQQTERDEYATAWKDD